MSEQEISELLKRLISSLNSENTAFEESDEVIALQTRYEELKKESKTNPSDELTKEMEDLETQYDRLEKLMYDRVLDGISNDQMVEILTKLSPEIIEKIHSEVGTFFLSDFESIICEFLDRIDDPNCEIHNRLFASKQFTTAFESSFRCIEKLVEKTNDEEVALDFLIRYGETLGDYKLSENILDSNINTIFDAVIRVLVCSDNYSLEFKNKILSDKRFEPLISSDALKKIITGSKLTKETKMQLLFRPDVFKKMSNYDFSNALGELCESYDDYYRFLTDESLKEKINISDFLKNATLKTDELIKLLTDEKIYDRVNWLVLGYLFQHVNMDFESLKDLVFEERIFSKLAGRSIVRLLENKGLTSEQRFELINDDRLFRFVVGKTEDYPHPVVKNILESKEIPLLDKVTIARDERFMPYIDNETLRSIMINPDIPLEVATDIMFDKRIFYRLIGEWHEKYNNSGYVFGDKVPHYDKYEYVKKLYERNPYLARTLSYELLKDGILDLGFDFVEKMSKYPYEAHKLSNAFDKFSGTSSMYLVNMIKTIERSSYYQDLDLSTFISKLIRISGDSSYFRSDPKVVKKLSKIRNTALLDLSKFTEDNWKTITAIGLRDMSIYYNGIEPSPFGPLKDEIDITLNILPDVETMDDLNNYEARRRTLCDEYFKKAVQDRDLKMAKNAFVNKYFSINIEEAEEIVRLFSRSLAYFKDKPEYLMQTKYIEQLQKIISLQKLDTISEIYSNTSIEPLSFDEIIYMDQSIRQMFSKQLSDSMYKIAGSPKEMEFVVEIDGVKQLKKVPVYEPGFDFKMLIHSTAAYGQMQLINNNYFDSWNKSGRKRNHGICCSMISNDNMGTPQVNDVLFGFDSWDPKAVTKSAPYDIYSYNDGYNIEEGRQLLFMTAQDIIDNTRHTHNEHVLERFELREERRTAECQNIQPSYVIIYSDMSDEIKQKAIKCSEEMHIPIVYLDKEKIVENEVRKINEKIDQLLSSTNMEEKLALLEQILLSHENNRSGLRMTNKEWLERYFPTEKITRLFDYMIGEIQTSYQDGGSIFDFYKYGSRLMSILDKENQKFLVTMESTDRKNYIDIPVEEYKRRIIQFINPDLCRKDEPRLETIMKISRIETPDLKLSQVLASVGTEFIHSQVEDMLTKQLYPGNGRNHNIGHIERVVLLSKLIGEQELRLDNGEIDNHALGLLVECAKYHDCGRESDLTDKQHGQKSAVIMERFLKDEGYSAEDISIMQAAVDYHEEPDNDSRFERICRKYGVPEERIEFAKKIALCLKDADALDRTRFINPSAKLNSKYLRTETARGLIPIAEELNRVYEKCDRYLFSKSCQHIAEKAYEGTGADLSAMFSQGRKI